MNQSAAKQPQHQQKRVSTVPATGKGAAHSAANLHPLLQLQRTIGNQAVQQLLERRDSWDKSPQPAGLSIQRNPTPGDNYTGSPAVEDDVSIPEQTIGDSLPATDLGDQLSGTNEGPQSVEELLSGELANNPAIAAINLHFEAVEHVKQAIDAAREGEKLG
ncbi:MAG: hypothetical protein KDE59_12770, partial [Anaerolineales bacterium]|nr:hypothetical protein [Anaerolineales bacterium]